MTICDLPPYIVQTTPSVSAPDWQKTMEAAGYKIVAAPLYKTETGKAIRALKDKTP